MDELEPYEVARKGDNHRLIEKRESYSHIDLRDPMGLKDEAEGAGAAKDGYGNSGRCLCKDSSWRTEKTEQKTESSHR